jgi:hypothetical protein
MFKVEIIKVLFFTKAPPIPPTWRAKPFLTWFPDKSLCAKLDFPSIDGPGLVMKKTSPVVSLDPERGVILMIPLPVKPYSAENY